MPEDLSAKLPLGSGRGHVHHRKSASDTLAFATSSFFHDVPPHAPHSLAVVPTSHHTGPSTANGGSEHTPGGDLGTELDPVHLLEVLNDVEEEDLEFDVEELCDAVGSDEAEPCAAINLQSCATRAVDPNSSAAVTGHPTSASAASFFGSSSPVAATASYKATALVHLSCNALQSTQQVSGLRGVTEGMVGGVGGGVTRRGHSANSTAPTAGRSVAEGSRHTRNPSDPQLWTSAPSGPTALVLDRPLSEFAGQTRGNALDPSQLDPKRARRIIANRQSAHRSRMKKIAVIQDLEQQVAAVRSVTEATRREVAAAVAARRERLVAAAEMHWRREGLRQEVAAEAVVQTALVAELQCLGITVQAGLEAEARTDGGGGIGGSDVEVLMTEGVCGVECKALVADVAVTAGASLGVSTPIACVSAASRNGSFTGAATTSATHLSSDIAAVSAAGLGPGLVSAPIASPRSQSTSLSELEPGGRDRSCSGLAGGESLLAVAPEGLTGVHVNMQPQQPMFTSAAPSGGPVPVYPLLLLPGHSSSIWGAPGPGSSLQQTSPFSLTSVGTPGGKTWTHSSSLLTASSPSLATRHAPPVSAAPTATALAAAVTRPGMLAPRHSQDHSASPTPFVAPTPTAIPTAPAQPGAENGWQQQQQQQHQQQWLSRSHSTSQFLTPHASSQQQQSNALQPGMHVCVPPFLQIQELQPNRPHHRRHFSAGCAFGQVAGLGVDMGSGWGWGLPRAPVVGFTEPHLCGYSSAAGSSSTEATVISGGATADAEMLLGAPDASTAAVAGPAVGFGTCYSSDGSNGLGMLGTAATVVVGVETRGGGEDRDGGAGSPMVLDATEVLMTDVGDFLLND